MRRLVERRAHGRCEYCRAPQRITGIVYHLEHIVPLRCGGTDDVSNRALACPTCNLSKGGHVDGVDPVTGQRVSLFHPRQDVWRDHFQLVYHLIAIRGLSPTGRATVARLQLKSRVRLLARLDWLSADRWP